MTDCAYNLESEYPFLLLVAFVRCLITERKKIINNSIENIPRSEQVGDAGGAEFGCWTEKNEGTGGEGHHPDLCPQHWTDARWREVLWISGSTPCSGDSHDPSGTRVYIRGFSAALTAIALSCKKVLGITCGASAKSRSLREILSTGLNA